MNPHSPADDQTPRAATMPFAVAELLDRCMGTPSVALLLLEKFEAQLMGDVSEIERQITAKDTGQIARTAHALKGAAGAVAAATLRDCAAALETCARQDRLEEVTRQLGALRAEVDRCLNHLPAARRAVAATPAGDGGLP